MALMAAMHRWRREEIAGVASFDHGTGRDAALGTALVTKEAARLGLPVLTAQAPAGAERSEAAWRQARWSFLMEGAKTSDATVLTAHTQDDQVETVVIRLLRGSGARGLAGMGAVDPLRPIRRPLLGVTRAELAQYALLAGVQWVEDGSNLSRRHLRNRVRLDLLPALEAASPGFSDWCLSLSERCLNWREEVEAVVGALGGRSVSAGSAWIPSSPFATVQPEGQAILWPAVAALAGVTLDRRATERLASWASGAVPGSWVPLSAGALVERNGSGFVVRQASPRGPASRNDERRS